MDEQCPNCWELVSQEELMTHGGYCQTCFDDGVTEDDEDE